MKNTLKSLLKDPSFTLLWALLAVAGGSFTIGRLVFYFFYHPEFARFSFPSIFGAFATGLRFDFSVASLLLIPAWVVSLFLPRRLFPKAGVFLSILFCLPFFAALTLVWGDLFYYADAGRRLSYEVFNISQDFPSVARMVGHYKIAVALWVLAVLFSGFLIFRLVKKIGETDSSPGWKMRSLMVLIGAAGLVVLIRGGLQSKPLRPSFAYLTEDPRLAHLALNPVYTVIHAVRKGNVKVPEFMPQDEALETVRSLVRSENSNFPDPEYPLLQKRETGKIGGPKLNVVVMLLESWTGKHIGALGSNQSLTPNFDRLASKGLLFTRFFAISHRSTDGITAACCSVPTFQDLQIIGSSFEQDNFRCLGTLLKKNGYSTLFLHGAKTGSFGLNGFARMAGFDRYLGKEDFDVKEGDVDPVWGVYDHVALTRLNEELQSMKEPFGALWFSLTSHSPYHLPPGAARPVPGNGEESDYFNSLAYSDWSVGEFFKRASQEEYFKNTVFILMADHTAGGGLEGTFERQHIPFLIYSPGNIQPGRTETVGGQLDLLPTISDLLKLEGAIHPFGRSLYDKKNREFAFVDRGGYYGWHSGSWLLLANSNGVLGLYDSENDIHEKNNLAAESASLVEELQKDLYAFVQTAKSLVQENRLAPRPN